MNNSQSTDTPARPTPAASPSAVEKKSFVSTMLHGLPTLAVLALLALIGWWGHHSGWRIPSASQLRGVPQQRSDNWCVEHNVAEAQCVQCGGGVCVVNREPGTHQVTDHGWCRLHGVHQCPHCHPELAQLSEPPVVDPDELSRIDQALQIRPRAENNSGCKQYQTSIQFASLEAVAKAGVDVEPALRRSVTEAMRVSSEITYDQRKLAELTTRAPGSIAWVGKEIGDRVQADEVMALIDATIVGKTKAEIREAVAAVAFERANLQRIEPLAASGAVPGVRLLEVKKALRDAEIKLERAIHTLNNLGLPVTAEEIRKLQPDELDEHLRWLGISDTLAKSIGSISSNANLLPVLASIDGTIIDRHAVIGEVVDDSQVLFRIADTSTMWLTFNLSVEDAQLANVGQKVIFRPDGIREAYDGKLHWISTSVNKSTRTVAARAELANPDGKLRDEMFGGGELVLRVDPRAVTVPNEAIQRDGSCYVVFVRDKDYFRREDGPKLFHTRSVRIGALVDGHTEIIAGLVPGEVVATVGSDVLRGQLLKSNLGAG